MTSSPAKSNVFFILIVLVSLELVLRSCMMRRYEEDGRRGRRGWKESKKRMEREEEEDGKRGRRGMEREEEKDGKRVRRGRKRGRRRILITSSEDTFS